MFTRLRNYYYRITKSRGPKWIVGALLIMTVVDVALAAFLAAKYRNAEARANFLQENPGITKILPVYWSLRKLSDITYLSQAFKNDEILDYSLQIAANDLQKMNDSLPEGFMGVTYTDRVFVPGQFTAAGKTYQVRVRYRGDRAVHWNAPKRSYLIKFDKDDLFDGMSELSFIIPDDRFFSIEHFNNYRAQKLGLKAPQSGFSNLEVNGQGKALYFKIEGWSKELLEKWDLPTGTELYGNESEGWESINGWQRLDSSSEDVSRLTELIELLNEAGDEEFIARIFELIDKENFYAWQIHQELVNSVHQATDNIRFYFDPRAGKFFFIPWDVEIEPLDRDNLGSYGKLAARIFSNPDFLQEKNQRLLEYVSDEKNLEDDLAFFDETYESFKISLYQDRLKIYTNRFADKTHEKNRQEIIDIFHNLQQKLGSSNEANGIRIEDDFNLAYPIGKSNEIVEYLKDRYIEDASFVQSLGANFSSTYGDEDFIDTYFDTPKLELYNRKAGLRYRTRTNRLDPENGKSGRELVQLKLSGDDKFSDLDNIGSRNEIKFEVQRSASIKTADDRHPLLGLVGIAAREELKSRLAEVGINTADLRPILTINQHRQRIYLNHEGETFISFSMDDAKSSLWWAESEFSQMEVELNELAYTGADAATRKKMQEIRQGMIADLREQFDYLTQDMSIKYTKMLDLLEEHIPRMRFLTRIGILREGLQ